MNPEAFFAGTGVGVITGDIALSSVMPLVVGVTGSEGVRVAAAEVEVEGTEGMTSLADIEVACSLILSVSTSSEPSMTALDSISNIVNGTFSGT